MKQILMVLFAVFCLTGCSSFNNSSPDMALSILQGLTTDQYTQISIVKKKSDALTYVISPNGPQLKKVQKFRKENSWAVDHLYISQLKTGQVYKLEVKKNQEVIDSRTFSTLKAKTNELKMALASCMDDRFSEVQKSIWPQFNTKKADLHIFLGDNVYGDKSVLQKGLAKPSELWRRYVETRNLLQIYHSPHLTPTLATWDDHDYGNNGGGENYPFKKESSEIFHSFFAQDPIVSKYYVKGPGISFLFKYAGQNFYFFDNRTFRTNKKTKPDSHWGLPQENWFFSLLEKNKSFSWLINGNQFFGGYQQFESFEKNHPKSFQRLLKKLKESSNRVAFLSGDRHLFEVMEVKSPDLNYSTIELTTSAIHAKVYPSSWGKNPNSRQIFGVAEKHNYATIQSKSHSNGVDIQLKGYGDHGKKLYQLNKKIK